MGTVSFAATQTVVGERAGTVQIRFLRDGDLSDAATVTYLTGDDTAAANADYTPRTNAKVTFQPGEAEKIVSIPILDDNKAEGSESFGVEILTVAGGTLGFPRTTRVVIQDDEAPSAGTDPDPASNYFANGTSVVTGLFLPTTFAFVPGRPDTMVIAEKSGVIKVAKGGNLLDKPLLDLSAVVNDTADRGLVSMALHPDFAANPYLYAYYAVDPAGTAANPAGSNAGADGAGNRYVHLVRYTVNTAANGDLSVNPNSAVVLLGGAGKSLADISGGGQVDSTEDFDQAPSGIRADGTNVQDYIAGDSLSHAGGALKFGPDGALYVTVGDGTSFNFADPRSVRVQDLNNLSGKVLRIDPLTGDGLASNPFYVQGQPDANQSKVFQYGIRNSFTMSFDAEGKLFLGEVGWYSWEEINTGGAGANFGWPYYEGGQNGVSLRTVQYQNLPEAQAFYASGKTVTAPFQSFSHVESNPGFALQAVIVGDVAQKPLYPGDAGNDLVFASLTSGQVFTTDTKVAGSTVTPLGAQDGAAVVSILRGPDGSIYYVDIAGGVVGKWQFLDTPPAGPATPAAGDATIGFGPDKLVLKVSQDAYKGDAQYTVSVDGVRIGNVLTAKALHGEGKSDTVTVQGEFTVGDHAVTITFLNDTYDAPGLDRNFYLDSATYNGVALTVPAGNVAKTAPATFSFTDKPAADPLTVGTGPDKLLLRVSQDAYKGNAQFTVTVDGKQVGGTLTAQALRNGGTSDTVTVLGDFASGNHTASIAFLNDEYDGPGQDRNLYLDGASYNGATLQIAAGNVAKGTPATFGFVDGTAPPTTDPLTVGTGPDKLLLKVSQDAYQGDAQFTVSVDGQQFGGTLTAKTAHGGSASDTVTVLGDFASGNHTASVAFLNDKYDGPGLDRNFYLDSATYNGATVAITAGNIAKGAPATFGFIDGTAPPAADPLTVGSGPDKLLLKMSQDAYQGGAQFSVSVDGQQIGGILTAKTAHSGGMSDTVTVLGDFASGKHTASVAFLTDKYDGPGLDRNFYLDSATYNGATLQITAGNVMKTTPASFSFTDAMA